MGLPETIQEGDFSGSLKIQSRVFFKKKHGFCLVSWKDLDTWHGFVRQNWCLFGMGICLTFVFLDMKQAIGVFFVKRRSHIYLVYLLIKIAFFNKIIWWIFDAIPYVDVQWRPETFSKIIISLWGYLFENLFSLVKYCNGELGKMVRMTLASMRLWNGRDMPRAVTAYLLQYS